MSNEYFLIASGYDDGADVHENIFEKFYDKNKLLSRIKELLNTKKYDNKPMYLKEDMHVIAGVELSFIITEKVVENVSFS